MQDTDELDPNIVAALDEVLVEGACEPAMLDRLRKLIENCLKDNYDTSDVLAVIELAMEKDTDEAVASKEVDDGA